jgi:hypothetical protein
MKFVDGDGRFNSESFRKAVDVPITAQEIIVGYASYRRLRSRKTLMPIVHWAWLRQPRRFADVQGTRL